ncbi:hypothetical protein SAMN05216436_13210 [bacterium A37T11]|nr:hypothetical protein SAMN05216436_13210 [bacterium A37T11]
MKQITALIIFITINACSVFKHKTESTTSEKELTIHTFNQKDSLQLREEVQHIRLLSDDQLELTEIIPAGTFVYHPDSGFAGAATRVRMYRQHQQRSIDQDTSTLSLTAINNRVGVDSNVHQQEKRQVAATKKSKTRVIWVYLVGAIGVIGVVLNKFIRQTNIPNKGT